MILHEKVKREKGSEGGLLIVSIPNVEGWVSDLVSIPLSNVVGWKSIFRYEDSIQWSGVGGLV